MSKISFLIFLLLFSSRSLALNFYIGLNKNSDLKVLQNEIEFTVLENFKILKVVKVKTSEAAAFKKHQLVAFVEPAYDLNPGADTRHSMKAEALSLLDSGHDIYGEFPWGVEYIRAPLAWESLKRAGKKAGERVKVLVLDTGIQEDHPAFAGRIAAVKDFTKTKVTSYIPYAYYDIPGHGTHVSGTILGNGVNNLYGVAPFADLYVGKTCIYLCLNDAVLSGLEWGIQQKVDVINMSFSVPQIPPLTAARAFALLEKNNTVVVASAGNEGKNDMREMTYPALFKTVLAVGAIDADGVVTEFSNRGEAVAIVGPGQDVISASPTKGPMKTPTLMRRQSGTSMSAPHVSGVAALVKTILPFASASEIREIILGSAFLPENADPLSYGAGVVDAKAAVERALSRSEL